MDLLKNQFDRIQQQLAGLSASQKMLAACLVVIIVMTISWWGRYAAVPEMMPVVDQALAPDELSAVQRQLRSSGIPFQTIDGKVQVPTDRFSEAVADLTFSEALPRSTKIDFQALVKDMNPFTPQSTTEAQFNNFTQMRLAEVISRFPGVRSADVIVDPTDKPRIGGGVLPSATVAIRMKPGDRSTPTQKVVDAAAHFIASSHANLSWERVKVVVDGQLWRVRDPLAGGGGGEYREQAEKFEHDFEDRVRQQLSYIPQITVSVAVKVTMDSTHTKSISYDKDNVIHKPTEESERTSESSTPSAGGGGEPGAQPNVGMSIAVAPQATGPATTTETESKTKSQLLAGEQVKEVTTPAGMGVPVSAAVHIPRSYIASVIKQERPAANPNAPAPEPDDAAIQARFKLEMDSIRKGVKAATGLENEQAVMVAMYTPVAPEMAALGMVAAASASPGFSTAVVSAAGAHSREIVLGGLAVVSLFMVSMMVRKSNPLPAVAAAPAPHMPMPVLDANELLAGEVSEGRQMLDAMELDDDAVRAQQMVDQVSSMVEENPDAAAGLVKRWLNRS
jgi:flagellar biosynthesis/type III secretory pathway M-ring protein FliF/YscJ